MNSGVWIVIIIVAIAIIIAVIIIIFRNRIFTSEKNLGSQSKETLSKKGYGHYYKAYESPCITLDGKCNTAGIKYITEYCQPHSETKNGCINSSGDLSLASQTRNELCQPNCRSYILQETTPPTNLCQYDYPYNLPAYTCVPQNAMSYEYRTYSCIKNDSIGDNTCTYQCSQSGKDSAGIPGDTDPSKDSYIPACVNAPNAVITLNSFNWNDIRNIGQDPNKGKLSKGYKISNIFLSDGTVSSQLFNISPAYPPWSPNASSVISLEDLKLLDSTLTVYDNCILPDVPIGSNNNVSKPLCENWFYSKPITPLSNLTYLKNPGICKLDSSFNPIKECFYNPWYNPYSGIEGGTGVNFINPYTGGVSGPNSVGATGAVYSWIGIGSYGYYDTPLICEKTNKNLTPGGETGTYIIPDGDGSSACLNLSAPPKQCSNSLSEIFPIVPTQNLQSLIFELEQGKYDPQIVDSFPAPSGKTYYTCKSQYTNNITKNIPGCVQTCQYIPLESDIDFSSTDSNGNYISSEIQDIIGSYLLFKVEATEGQYFLGTQNVPCSNGSNDGVPLMNCLSGGTGTNTQTPCSFIYSGGTGIEAGNFWSKSGCDQESIEAASALRVIVSAASALGVVGPGETGSSILCDLYATIDGKFGYLSPESVNNSSISLDISSNFTYNVGNNLGNIVANSNAGSTGSKLYFNTLNIGENIPYQTNNSLPNFIISYSAPYYTVSSSNDYFNSLSIDSYDGTQYLNSTYNFTFTNEINRIYNTPYYTKLGFNEPIIKTSGVFIGSDITRTINLQRNNSCYTKRMCNGVPLGPNEICYENTCNLYFNYNPEFC